MFIDLFAPPLFSYVVFFKIACCSKLLHCECQRPFPPLTAFSKKTLTGKGARCLRVQTKLNSWNSTNRGWAKLQKQTNQEELTIIWTLPHSHFNSSPVPWFWTHYFSKNCVFAWWGHDCQQILNIAIWPLCYCWSGTIIYTLLLLLLFECYCKKFSHHWEAGLSHKSTNSLEEDYLAQPWVKCQAGPLWSAPGKWWVWKLLEKQIQGEW